MAAHRNEQRAAHASIIGHAGDPTLHGRTLADLINPSNSTSLTTFVSVENLPSAPNLPTSDSKSIQPTGSLLFQVDREESNGLFPRLIDVP